jgi:hypothetical protein
LKLISPVSPQAYGLYDGNRLLGQMHLEEGVFSVWAQQGDQKEPVEIYRQELGAPHFHRFGDKVTAEQAVGQGILRLKAHAQGHRLSLTANDPNPPQPGLAPA